jgi:gliding motility-associated-like protein
MLRSAFWGLLLLFLPGALKGAHLVGGDLTYTYLGNNQYQFNLTIYRDCAGQGAAFDDTVAISIYTGSGLLFLNPQVPILNQGVLPNPVYPCLTTPPNVCTEWAKYTVTVALPPSPSGYVASSQRCCRNGTISNIPNPGTWGNTYTTSIPASATNSSPVFLNVPPTVLCAGQNLAVSFAASEPDGDSLHYELCQPLHGGGMVTQPPGNTGPSGVFPNPATPPPYNAVPWLPGSSTNYPFPSNPAVQINGQTGLLTGVATAVGQFVFSVCVTEYRNGVMISRISRDFQFNIANCTNNSASVIIGQDQDSTTVCAGTQIQFSQASQNANNYHWDFGVAGTNADTSNLPNPVFTYPDTGTYTVTLIVNRGEPCSDTATEVFQIYNPVFATLNGATDQCFENHSINLSLAGTIGPNSTLTWNLGSGVGTIVNAPAGLSNLTFPQPGIYPISVTIQDGNCSAVLHDTIRLYPRLVPSFNGSGAAGCAPLTVFFADQTQTLGNINYLWEFGDGATANAATTSHTYTQAGTYNVLLRVWRTEVCADTIAYNLNAFVTVHPTPDPQLEVTPTRVSIYYPRITARDQTEVLPGIRTMDMGDGLVFSNTTEVRHTYTNTGTYPVSLYHENQWGCSHADTVWVKVVPEVNLFFPTAFTPNGDGTNDVFLGAVSGLNSYTITIYNRWGEAIFRSIDATLGWDGTNPGGGNAPGGVYTYRVEYLDFENVPGEKVGTITLYR